MARIRIVIGAHLSTAPRPQKEAQALAEAGHDVTVQGVWLNAAAARRDESLLKNAKYRFLPVADVSGFSPLARLRRLLAMQLWQTARVFRPAALGYEVAAQLRHARQAAADLTIVHGEGGLWVARQLLAEGRRVGVDFEDWFSEDLPPAGRRGRPVPHLRAFETALLRSARYRLTTSRALARALGESAGVEPPVCVYNVFPLADRNRPRLPVNDRAPQAAHPSLHWFSQTIGPGRGLETLFAALPHLVHPCEIHLRGDLAPRDRRWAEALIPAAWRDRVSLHPTVHSSELLSRLAGHDIGLALETPEIRSRDLTVTNKLFHYLLAGLGVIATDTAGQREVAATAGHAVKLVPPGDPIALAAAIDVWLAFPEQLALARKTALRITSDVYCWDKQREALLDEAALALAEP